MTMRALLCQKVLVCLEMGYIFYILHGSELTLNLATLLYLTRRYDTEYKFHFADLKQQMQVESWISFQSHELAPSFTQAAHWYRQNPNRYPFPTQRAIGEVERIFGVLDTSLEGRDYLVGEGRGNYSIADIASFPFVNHAGFCGVDAALQRWPNLEAWRKRIVARQPVKNGMCTPAETNWDNETVLSKFSQNEDFVAYEAPLQKALKDAQAEFKYKYKSP
jgi:glutathione S-transferase